MSNRASIAPTVSATLSTRAICSCASSDLVAAVEHGVVGRPARRRGRRGRTGGTGRGPRAAGRSPPVRRRAPAPGRARRRGWRRRGADRRALASWTKPRVPESDTLAVARVAVTPAPASAAPAVSAKAQVATTSPPTIPGSTSAWTRSSRAPRSRPATTFIGMNGPGWTWRPSARRRSRHRAVPRPLTLPPPSASGTSMREPAQLGGLAEARPGRTRLGRRGAPRPRRAAARSR